MLRIKEKVFYFSHIFIIPFLNLSRFKLLLTFGLAFVGCKKGNEELLNSEVSRFLYVASGSCYSGNGNTTFSNVTASNKVYRLNFESGDLDTVLADYNSSPAQPGDSPVGLGRAGDDQI